MAQRKPPYKCVGILGWLLGHKFKQSIGDMTYGNLSHCTRCGMPKGGWR